MNRFHFRHLKLSQDLQIENAHHTIMLLKNLQCDDVKKLLTKDIYPYKYISSLDGLNEIISKY